MGRWCYVNCNCRPSYPQISWEEETHCRRLNDPPCAHKHFELIGFSPYSLFHIADITKKLTNETELGISFPIFKLIGTWELWPKVPDYEYLFLTSEQRDEWEIEIEELLRINSSTWPFPEPVVRQWKKYLESRFDSPADATEALKDGLRLCQVSRESGNPIVFAV